MSSKSLLVVLSYTVSKLRRFLRHSVDVNSVAPDRPDVKIKNHGLGQYGAEPIILRYHVGNFVH